MKSTPLSFAGLLLAAVLGGFVVYTVGARDRHTAPQAIVAPGLSPISAHAAEHEQQAAEAIASTAAASTMASLDAPITAEEIAEVLSDPDFVARLPVVEGTSPEPADATTSGSVLNDGTVLPASGGIVIAADGKISSAGSSGVSITDDGRIVPLPAGGYTLARDGTVTPRQVPPE